MDREGSIVLGTAGHIDHGKTALVQALTGTDTDRLKEEKERGITIELGFAELATEGRPRFGVVDVPGHEAFVRAMVAGATGLDLLLLVVAADEGVMPQTREHLAIAELLGIPELVVALTKCDLVDEEWIELVRSDVEDVLDGTPYAGSRAVATSVRDQRGLDELLDALTESSARVRERSRDDLCRLPLDRVFTVQGTGTVVTGTMWSGALEVGERVVVMPDGLEARVRGLQVHGETVERAVAGDRAAVALTGEGADRGRLERGATLVTERAWKPSRMLTVRVRMLEGPGWSLEHNQRVHVHLGTAEVRARCAVLEPEFLGPGEEGWVQLRLEEPLLARGRDRLVIRAYSPVTTIGGGIVAETHPPKRNRLQAEEARTLESLVSEDSVQAVAAALRVAHFGGLERTELPIALGLGPPESERAAAGVEGLLTGGKRVFGAEARRRVQEMLLAAVDAEHERDSLREAVELAAVRAVIPTWAPPELGTAVLESLIDDGRLEALGGGVRRPGHEARATPDQEAALEWLERTYQEGGLAPPMVDELPPELRARADLRALLRHLEERDVLRSIADGLFVSAKDLDRAIAVVQAELGGRKGLGPSDFRDVLPVTRKHLIPLLNHLDGLGVTLRSAEGRDVPAPG